MRRPTLKDFGHTVELDLHGATIREAIPLLRTTLIVSRRYGRDSVKVIHGYSTSVNPPRKGRSIRDELYQLLEDGSLPQVVSDYRFRGHTILFLGHTSSKIHSPITMRDVAHSW